MKKLLSTTVFNERGGYSSISERSFIASIAGFVLYGLFMTFLMATNFAPSEPGLGFILGVGLVIPIMGVFLSVNDNSFLAFLGYNMISIPLGLCMGWISTTIESSIVLDAITITLMVTGVMGVLGILLPKFFESIGGFLFYSLLALVVVRVLQIFIPALQHLTIIDYIAAGIFSLYIGYDIHRATLVDRNVNNALRIAVSLYLDITNLFLSILRIKD